MESLYLPYMTLNDPLDDAFDMMYQTDSRSIILNRINSYKIYTNDDVAEMITSPGARGERVKTCSVLTNMRGMNVIDLTGEFRDPGMWLPPQPSPNAGTLIENLFRAQFEQNDADYGIIFPQFRTGFANLMMVITRHEGKAADIYDRRKVCICNGPGRHKAYDRNTGDPCDYDPPHQYRCT